MSTKWTIESVLKTSVLLKMAFIAFAFISFLIVAQPEVNRQVYNNPFLFGFYTLDGANYKTICEQGYFNTSESYPASIRYFAYLPGQPALDCASQLFRSVIDLKLWGPVIFNAIIFIGLGVTLKYYLDAKYKNNEGLKKYLWYAYLLFPASFFLHLNYTETTFMAALFLIMGFYERNKIISGNIVGLLLGFFKISALPVAILLFAKYCADKYSRSKKILSYAVHDAKKTFVEIASFSLFGIGTLATFLYYHVKYGNFWLFFQSQSDFYNRNSLNIFQHIKDGFERKATYWDTLDWSKLNEVTGFWWYNQDFRYYALFVTPLIIFVVGIILLIKERRWFEALFSAVLWSVPLLTSIDSIDRCLLQSFPIILIIAEYAYRSKILKFIYMIVSLIGFIVLYSLHARGYWVG